MGIIGLFGNIEVSSAAIYKKVAQSEDSIIMVREDSEMQAVESFTYEYTVDTAYETLIDQDGWTHMYDYYPQGIINFGMKDAWKKGHVSFEICGTFNTRKEREGYSKEQVEYIFEQGLKWRISTGNGPDRTDKGVRG